MFFTLPTIFVSRENLKNMIVVYDIHKKALKIIKFLKSKYFGKSRRKMNIYSCLCSKMKKNMRKKLLLTQDIQNFKQG